MNDDELTREIEQFLYREARLLDSRRFREWLDLFTEDTHYWMPVRSSRYPKDSKAIVILDVENYDDEELSKEDESAYFDDDKPTLEMRIRRMETGMAWSEVPPSRTCHVITNIEVEPGEADGEVLAYSCFIADRNRLGRDSDQFVGRREDLLRKVDGQWKIARRKLILNQNAMVARNMSIFF